MRSKNRLLVTALLSSTCGPLVSGQTTAPLAEQEVPVALQATVSPNQLSHRGVAFERIIDVPGASWVRLHFDRAELGSAPPGGQPVELVLTSLTDGAVQRHTQATLWQWRNTSAYFNGDRVRVELITAPGSGPALLTMSTATVGVQGPSDGGVASICGPQDDRVPSTDARSGRLLPAGCTAWLIDDMNNCFLSAGHCDPVGGGVIQFNVPLSNPDGSLNHPGPEDQYVIDGDSVRSANTGLGNDWAYFGCFPNADTGLTAVEAQGDHYLLAAEAPPVLDQTIRVTGYGVDASPSEWNLTQQTHSGPYLFVPADTTVIHYAVDTRGGNSGSAVLDEDSGLAIGIHTNGGCESEDGANVGTAIESYFLQQALANPLGVCGSPPPLILSFLDGLPDLLDPAGDQIAVQVLPQTGLLEPGTVMLNYDIGDGNVVVPLVQFNLTGYNANFPPIPCGTVVSFYISAETTDGEVVMLPPDAPDEMLDLPVVDGLDATFVDDFETDTGWTVEDSPGLEAGSWERGLPAGFGDRGDPPTDADGSGSLYATGLGDGNNDVDNGTTTLTSPVLDATGGDAHIIYYRWVSTRKGSAPVDDVVTVEISDDDGVTWHTVEVVAVEPSTGWVHQNVRVADFVDPTSTVRIRFIAADLDFPSVVEAAIDGFRLNRSATGFTCPCTDGAPLQGVSCDCPADVAIPANWQVDVTDLLAVIQHWGESGPDAGADVNGDGMVDVSDLVEVVNAWGECEE